MDRYQIIKPEMSEALQAFGKTNEERAHEMALSWMAIGTEGSDMSAAEYYRYYDKAFNYFLKRLKDAKAQTLTSDIGDVNDLL